MSFSFSDIVTDVENAVTTTEADVESWITDISNGIAVVVNDLEAGLKWAAGQLPPVVAALQQAVSFVEGIPGASSNADVQLGVTAANTAISLLQGFEAAEAAPVPTATSLVTAFKAVQQTVVAVASIKVAATSVTPAAPAPAAA